MKSTFKCACGTTTRATNKDAYKALTKKGGVKKDYKPTGKKNG
tara:strand:- start:94 stop:222 length:129 start_codon:yes stop_codon:yes gene_type:complete